MTDTKSLECDMHNVDNDVVAVAMTSLPHQPIVEKHYDKYKMDLKYAIDDIPPWYECIAFAVQQLLTMVGTSLYYPSLLVGLFCVEDDIKDDVFAILFSVIVFSESISTFLQVTFGSRLPIVQGISIAYYIPAIVTMGLPQWECVQETFVNGSIIMTNLSATVTWEDRAREIQGSVLLAGVFEMVFGFSGLFGFLIRFIGPLTIAPTLVMLVLDGLVPVTLRYCSTHWGISFMALALTLLFSQYMRNIRVPYASWTRQKGCHKEMGHVFSLCPVILSVCITWFLCFTITDVFTTDSSDPSYLVRTDRSDDLINTLPWIWFPIPFRWGLPTVSVASFVGMMSAVFASTFESLGDYYACAHLSGAPPPPGHAVTRGIGVEGIGVIIAGMWGSLGVTSYSSSNGAISVTRVGNRRVIQWMSLILFLMAIVGKLAAIIASIPIPMIGGLLWITSGTIIAIGVASLQHCNMNSSRTLAIIGTAIMTALIVPQYLTQNPEVIDTGNTNANQIINVILRNGMIIGGLVGFILDNTIPGTQEERGLIVYRKLDAETIKKLGLRGSMTSYDLPFGMSYIKKWKWTRYIPFCPTFLTKDF